MACLLQLLLQHRCQVLGDLEGLDGDTDGGDTLGWKSVDGVLGDALLDGDVVWVLGEEVWHGTWVLGLKLLDVGLVLVVWHVVTEDLLAGIVGDGGEGIGSAATVGRDADLVSVLRGDGELDLVEIGVLLAGWSWEGLHGGEFLVGLDGLDVVDGDIVEADQECQLVDGHVLQHTFGVTLEALSEGFWRVLVGIVGNEGDVGAWEGGGEFAGLGDVLADVLVVPHEHFDAGVLGFLLHLLQLGDGWGTWLLKVDALAALGDALGQQTRVVGRAAGDEGKTRGGWWWEVVEAGSEGGSVLGLGIHLPLLEFLAGWGLGSTTQEPWLNDVVHGRAWALLLEHLNGVVPSHSAVGCTASHQDDLGLAFLREVDGGSTEGTASEGGSTRGALEGEGLSRCEGAEHGEKESCCVCVESHVVLFRGREQGIKSRRQRDVVLRCAFTRMT
mmetsp:Transcript_23863/g.66676  ORF Transcript_23863/g.66676 Transcript_23863/m.66676 type:complete len:443 (-) Transcript_23863:92-1420(-)